MLVSELRELLRKYNEEDLRLIISEMYKTIPKKIREEKDIDAMLKGIHEHINLRKIEKIDNREVDLNDIKAEIERFIDYAYKQYYFAPNSFVHKRERPKWRFKVKAYIKDLQGVPIEDEVGNEATCLLVNLYEMLSYACGHYIFSTEDPFRSVGIEQLVLLDAVISRKLSQGINNEAVKSVIEFVINSNVDRETLHSSLFKVLIKNLKSPDSKEMAIEQCVILVKELKRFKPVSSKKERGDNSSAYQCKEIINYLVEMIFRLNMALCEYDEGITYFNANYIETDKEIALYILLRLILEYKLKDHWIREYSEAFSREIKPREALQKTQKYIQENGKLPEHIG